MTALNVGSVVVKDFGKLIGILTERDLLKAMAARVHSSEARVRQFMTENPVTASPDMDCGEAEQIMLDKGFRHLPIMEGDDVVGVVSLRRVVAATKAPQPQPSPSLGRAWRYERPQPTRERAKGRTPRQPSSATVRPPARARSRGSRPSLDARLRDRAGRELGLDCRPRDERHAVAGLYGASHGLLQPEHQPDVEVAQLRPERPQRILDDLPHAGPLLHDDQRLGSDLVDRHRTAGERVLGGHARITSSRMNGSKRTERLPPGGADDAELELTVGDPLDHGLRVVHLERDANGRGGAAGTRRAGAARRSRPDRWTRRSRARL